MKNLKRFMAGALALIMVMGMTLTVSATETNSVPSIEGRYVVKELDEKSLMKRLWKAFLLLTEVRLGLYQRGMLRIHSPAQS